MHDAVSHLDAPSAVAYEKGNLAEIVYGDDALPHATSDGKFYSGMELHWEEFQSTSVQCRATPGISYLSAVVTHTGLPRHKLGRAQR